MAGSRVKAALILAAGQGSRMGELGRVKPKALLPVVNRPLIVWHLEALAKQQVSDVHIVLGHLGDQIKAAVEAHPISGLTLHFHVQEQRLGLGHAVLQAEAALSATPFVLILGDIAFQMSDPDPLFHLPTGVASRIAVKTEQDVAPIRRNFSVIHDADGRISQVIEKPDNPPSMLKGTGQYAFTPEIFDAIHRTPRSAMRNEYELTDAIQTLIDTDARVEVANVISWDLNLTFHDDILACNRQFMDAYPERDHILSELPAGSRISNSVVGPRVTADGPVDLEDCVVLEGAHLPAGQASRNSLLMPFDGDYHKND